MAYTTDHADALVAVREAGASVTFTRTNSTYNPATDTFDAARRVTVIGHAIRVKGDPERHRALSLTISEAPTLLFAPTTYGQTPDVGMSVDFGGVRYVVRDVEPVAPDGTAILARVTVSR
jgi:hypothetical protein